jgi:hypothetical protein
MMPIQLQPTCDENDDFFQSDLCECLFDYFGEAADHEDMLIEKKLEVCPECNGKVYKRKKGDW